MSYNKREGLEWLAREINDNTVGNKDLSMDWGRFYIECSSPQLKSLLVDLAKDYLVLLEEDKKIRVMVTAALRGDYGA